MNLEVSSLKSFNMGLNLGLHIGRTLNILSFFALLGFLGFSYTSCAMNEKRTQRSYGIIKRRTTTQKQSSRHEDSIHEAEEQKEVINKLMLDEDRKVGAIGLDAWITYLKYLGDTKFYTSQTASIFLSLDHFITQ